MKLYIVSGLGTDQKVFEKLKFPQKFSEIVYLDWLTPQTEEPLSAYALRMSQGILSTEPFCLLGYSFGGVVVQEIHKIKPAQKVVILGSIKSHEEYSMWFKIAAKSKIFGKLSEKYFQENHLKSLVGVKKFFPPRMWEYFKVTSPAYIKWGIVQMLQWKSKENPEIIQVLGENDLLFPPGNSHPNYVIPKASHFFPITNPQKVSTILEEVFEEVEQFL